MDNAEPSFPGRGSLPHRGTRQRRVRVTAARGSGLPTLGLTLPQFNERPGPVVEACREAWSLGFGGVFVFDHLWPLGQPQRPALEGWTLLAALAARVGPEGSGEPQGGAPVNREGSGEPQGSAPVGQDRRRRCR